MNTLLVGFGYKARHGKDTAVAAVIDAYSAQYDVCRYAFADDLKVEFYDALRNPLHDYWGVIPPYPDMSYLCLPHPVTDNPFIIPSDEEKVAWVNDHKKDLAKHLQFYGTEYRRYKFPFYWVNKLNARIRRDRPQIALISDVRFKNELAWIKSYGGYSVKVTRYGFEDPTRSASHASESELDGVTFDFEINCADGELDELRRDAHTVFEMILKEFQPQVDEIPGAVTA